MRNIKSLEYMAFLLVCYMEIHKKTKSEVMVMSILPVRDSSMGARFRLLWEYALRYFICGHLFAKNP